MRYFLQTLVLLGALQGFISAALLLRQQYAKLSDKLLAVLIFVIALANLNIFLWYQPLSPFWSLMGEVLPLLLFMPVGPLLFLYARSCLDNNYRLARKDWVHFIPVLLDLVPYATAGLYHMGILGDEYGIHSFIDQYNTYVDIPRWISLTIYCVLSWRLVRNRKGDAHPFARTVKQIVLSFTVFQIIWLLFLAIYVIPGYQQMLLHSVGWLSLYVPLAALIYWIGITGFMSVKPSLSEHKVQKNNNYLSAERVQEVIHLLRQVMENDKLYLDPQLNLNTMVKRSGLSQKVISAVLNQHMNVSFNEFVNLYRVEAFKQKIKDPHMQVFTIKGIALDCGFSSLATFQRVFKQMTGQSPTDFRRMGSKDGLKTGN